MTSCSVYAEPEDQLGPHGLKAIAVGLAVRRGPEHGVDVLVLHAVESLRRDALPDIPHEGVHEVHVVDGDESAAQALPRLEQVVQVGAVEVPAAVAPA